jgi:O-antigen/teichoic acid export membrane protein
VSEGLKIIGQSISLVQFSVISNKVGEDEYNKQLTLTLLKFTVILTFLALVVLIVLPENFYEIIFGEGFGAIKIVILCLAPGILALACSMIFSHYFSGTGRPKYNMIASLIGFIATLIAIYPMVKNFGYIGAGLMTSFAFIAGAIYQFIIFKKLTETRVRDFIISSDDFKLAKNIWTTFVKKQKDEVK